MANSQTFTLNIKALFDASDVKAKVGDIQRAFSNIKMPDKLQKDFNSSFQGLEKALNDFESRTAKGVQTKADAKGMSNSIDAVVREFNKVIEVTDKVKAELGDGVDLSKIIKLDKSDAEALKTLQDRAAQLKKEIANFDASKIQNIQKAFDQIGKGKLQEGASKAFDAFKKGNVDEALKSMDELIEKYDAMSQRGALAKNQGFQDNLTNLKAMRDAMAEVTPEVKELEQNYKQQSEIATNAFNKIKKSVTEAGSQLSDLDAKAKGASGGIKEISVSTAQFAREMDQVKGRIQYFFGLSNAINLVKRAIRGAFDTIKDLDKAMTATAVVTDFSVSDMWEQLPEYTKRANELGVSTQAAYEAATLYYQQGLKTEEVNALSVETLKMARIAGLDAAEATDRMTNALRGFNMELTEANAQRVDDVYSELAANTASNVDEISTAMTKVASLAHNANMEFETTAAFLSQIIETTRESAETAGTALKTVVARFSEVKKLIDTNQLQGQDEEGQVVDVNRVGQALRTAGIDLNKYFLGEVGLDDIFMELASKWDTLTSVQQRYIATQAAGSRQQSRFIALMSDYARTQELVGKAYNAEGASARQFAKTQESLESKLARLKNAWNEFLMGLTNNEVVKGFVDILTKLLNTINKLTSAFGEGGSSIAKWGVALGGILGGKALLGDGGIIDRVGGSLLNNTGIGAALFKSGALSGSLVGGGNTKAAAGSRLEQQIKEAESKGMVIAPRTGLFERISQYKDKYANSHEELKYANQWKTPAFLEAQQQAEALAKSKGLFTQEQINELIPQEALSKAAEQATETINVKTKTGLFGAIGNQFKNETKLGAQIAKWMGPAASGASVLGVALGGVAAAVGLVVAGYQTWLRLTPEGHLKQANAIADALNKTAANAQKAAKQMRTAYDEYNQYNEAVEKATTSTEQARARQDRTDYISQMVEANTSLAKYVSASQVGGEFTLTIDEQGFEKAVQDAESGAAKAAGYADFAKALQQGAQADVYAARRERQNVNLENKTITRNKGQGQYQYTEQMTDTEYAKFAREQVAEVQARAQAQQYAKQGYLQLMQGMNLEDDIANVVAEGMAAGFDKDTQLRKINEKRSENWWNGEATKEQLRATYKSLYGSEADSSMGRKELAQAVAEAQVDQEKQDSAQAIANMVNGAQGEQYKALLQAFSGKGEAFDALTTDEQVENYIKGITDQLDPTKLKEFGKALGLDESELKDVTKALQNKVKVQRQDAEAITKQTKADIYKNLMSSGISLDGDIVDKINSMTREQATQLSSTISNALDVLSPETFQSILPDLTSIVGTDLFDEVSNLFGKINLDDPISAFNQLKAAEKDASAGLQEYINLIRESNAETFTAGNLVQSFIASADYDGLTKSMDKLIKKNEHLSAKNIEELAEECDSLNALMETGAADASTLAEAFTLVQQGKLAFDQITDAILGALKAGTSFSEMIDKVGDWISEFDKGTDLKEGTKHIGEVAKEFKELAGNWEFGNEPTEKIYDHLFGKGEYQKRLKEFIGDGKKDFAGAAKAFTDEADRVMKLAENEGLEGIKLASSDKNANKVQGLTQTGKNTFNWDLSGFENTQQAIDQVAQSLGVGQEAAMAFIESWQTHMPELKFEWNELDYKTKLQGFLDNLGETKAITAEQLAALGALVGKTADEVAAELAELFKTNGQEINIPINVQWKEDGKDKTGDELDAEVKKHFGEYKDLANKFTKETAYQYGHNWKQEKTIDYQAARKELKNYGMSDAQQKEAINKMVKESGQKLSQTIEVPIKMEDGSYAMMEKTIVGDSAEALEAGINDAMNSAQFDMIAQGLASVDLSTYRTNVETATSTGVSSGASAGWSSFASNISPITVPVKYSPSSPPGTAGAAGGFVRSYAEGTNYLQPGFALTGEEGPEIVWNKEKGYAYVTGENGAEFQNLQPGDRVFNAAETSRIFRNSSFAKGGTFGSYADGGWNSGKDKGKSGGSGGGSGKDKDDEWKNDLDWLYNVMENIAELERQQNIYQEEYEDLLKDQTKTGQDLYKMLIKQLGNLYAQLDHQTYTLERREQEMREFMDTTNDQDDYLWYNWEDRTIEIDWDAIDKITDQEQYDHIKDLISEAEEIQDKMDDAEDAIIDVENQIQELENIWRDTFTDFEERVLDAIVKMYQSVIDNYSELNDTLNETNTNILDAINREISLQRQIRDNTKTEQEIADNEAQLAYMQRDTTGGNKLEALQMRKDLDDQRQDYQDNLIDQAIQKLQDDNDMAAQQREKQIEIMQAQLDYQSENGEFNAYIRELMESAVDPDGHLATDSDLYKLLAEQENIDAMTKVQRDVWEEELNGTFKEVAAFLLKEQNEAEGTYFTAVTAAFNGISETFDKAFHGSYSQGSAHGSSSSSSGSSGSGGGGKKCPPHSWGAEYKDGNYIKKKCKRCGTTTTVRQISSGGGGGGGGGRTHAVVMKYATGGLNTQTGPAWLDGTPSEPEYVLNARQTDAFLKLADVLPAAMNTSGQNVSNTFGATTNNVVINVDKIDSDYSVDQMVDRVKEKLFESGSYRNNNVLSLMR